MSGRIRWAITDHAWWDDALPVEWTGVNDDGHVARILRRDGWLLVIGRNYSAGATSLSAAKRVAREGAR